MEVQSAVRVPTPDPEDFTTPAHLEAASRKRKSPATSRSPSPSRNRRAPLNEANGNRGNDRERYLEERLRRRSPAAETKPRTEAEKQEWAKKELERLQNARSGGTYIPPARLRQLQAQITDRNSVAFQRMAWEALKKSVNGLVNKVNVTNIKLLVGDLFQENLIRGRGLFCRSIMRAQAAALPFTPVYAALVCITNTKIPQLGELLVRRLVSVFKKAYKRNDKAVCISSTTFLAQLVNQQVVHEDLISQILIVLLSQPTDDSVEIAVGLAREVGQHLEEFNQPVALLVFDQFRSILHEADIDKRTQYMIEVLFQVRKDRYKDNPAVREELDLVEEDDLITHRIDLEDKFDVENSLNIFKEDSDYEANEAAYAKLKREILGEHSDGDSGSDISGDESESEEEEATQQAMAVDIKDRTNADLTNLRRTIYLTINSSADFEEATHKLMKVNLPVGMESELPSMIIETCSQRPTYEKFYGLIGERFSKLNRLWRDQFESAFVEKYETIHRYETNRLRNVARFFGHLLSTDAIGWHVLSAVHLNEDETTSSSRIFIKILFNELTEAMGMKALSTRFREDLLQPSLSGIFPTDNPRNTRFSINYFTSIGLGEITEDMRTFLQNMPKPVPRALPAARSTRSGSVSSYSSYSSYSSGSRSRSTSPDHRTRGRDRGRSSSSRSSRSRSYTISRSRTPSQRAGARGRGRTPSVFGSRSAPLRGRRANYTPSASSRSRTRSKSYSRTRSPDRGHRGRRRSYTPSSSPVSSSSSRSRMRTRSPPSPPSRGRDGGRGGRGREGRGRDGWSRGGRGGHGGGGRGGRGEGRGASSASRSHSPLTSRSRSPRRARRSRYDESASRSRSRSRLRSRSSSRSRDRGGWAGRGGRDGRGGRRGEGGGRGGRGGRHEGGGGSGEGVGGRSGGRRGHSMDIRSRSRSVTPPVAARDRRR